MSDLSDANQQVYTTFLNEPEAIKDEQLRAAYKAGLADLDAPDDIHSAAWAAWSAGKQTRLNRAG